MKQNELVIFETADNAIKLEVPVEQETVWLTQSQMTELFDVDRTVITRHVNNVFKEGELDRESNVQKMHIANSDRPVQFYNLDVIISVGYRVKSKRGVEFRKWANSILKQYILQGYAVKYLICALVMNPICLAKKKTIPSEAVSVTSISPSAVRTCIQFLRKRLLICCTL